MRSVWAFVKYIFRAAVLVALLATPLAAYWHFKTLHDVVVLRVEHDFKVEILAMEQSHERGKVNAAMVNSMNREIYVAKQELKRCKLMTSGPKPRSESCKLKKLKVEK
jgi:predicted secreted protein